MEQLVDEIRKSIVEFINSAKKEVFAEYNIDVPEQSISGTVEVVSDKLMYIGRWRLSRKDKFWEAVYSRSITDSEDAELVLEIDKRGDKYIVLDWYVKELF